MRGEQRLLIADIYVHPQQIEAAPKAVFRRGRRYMEAVICLSAAAWAQLVNLEVSRYVLWLSRLVNVNERLQAHSC